MTDPRVLALLVVLVALIDLLIQAHWPDSLHLLGNQPPTVAAKHIEDLGGVP